MKLYRLYADNAVGTYHARVLTGCWFLPPHVQGITLSKGFILVKPKNPPSILLSHELVHVQQMRTVKWFRLKYIWEYIRRGSGMANKYEGIAYNTQREIAEYTDITLT